MYDLLQRKKRAFVILSVLCMLAVALGMMLLALPQRVSASEEESHGDHSGWTQITASTRTLSTGNYYLSGDIERTRAIEIEEEVTFCLNGSRLYGDGVSQMFLVQDGGSLTICDCQSGNEAYKHYYTVAENGLYEFSDAETADYIAGGVISNANGAVRVNAGGSFVLESGTIAGNWVRANGGAGIYASQAKIEIAGGAVVGNTALNTSSNGIGVYAFMCTFTMSGGKIEGNTGAQWGGGVYLSSSSFVMTGGSIKDNSAKFGGGVYLVKNVNYPEEDAVFHMKGGTIEGNEATEAGGGVYLYSGTMNIGGTPVIRDNAVNDAVNDTDGKIGITMTEKLLEGAQIGLGAFDAVENVVTGYADFNSEDPNEFFFANTLGDSVVLEEGNLIVVQTYVIHYYLNGTLLGSQTALYEGDTLMTFEELNGTVVEGSKFYGWAIAAGSQSASYSDGQDLTAALAVPGEEVDLYAVIAEQGSSFEEQLDEAVKTLNAAIEALESSASSSDEALQTAIDEVQTKLDEAVLKLEGAFAEGDEANAAALAEAVNELKTAFEAADAVLEGKIGELGEAGEALQAALDALDEAYKAADKALADAIEELRAENAAQSAELERQDGELNTLSVVLYLSLAVAVVALGVGTAGLVFGLKAKKKD